MATEKFKVLRTHIGDKTYRPDDIRIARRQDVEHLIGTTLAEIDAPAPAKKTKTKTAKKEEE